MNYQAQPNQEQFESPWTEPYHTNVDAETKAARTEDAEAATHDAMNSIYNNGYE